jgi:anti-anti-sigma factor
MAQYSDGLKDWEGEALQRLDIELLSGSETPWVGVKLRGCIDVFNYLHLGKALSDIVGARTGLTLLLDLSEVSFMASSGWSVLLGVRGRLEQARSRLVLVGMNEHLERIYRAMKLPMLIPAYEGMAEARLALAADPNGAAG